MFNQGKYLICILLLFVGLNNLTAQKACCSTSNADKINCETKSEDKACCATTAAESTSGCTPSNCRGAKTKFGEAKVISELRASLIALKAKMEKHEQLAFSEEAISIHNIIGETDEESLQIVHSHVEVIEEEVQKLMNKSIPNMEASANKAKQVMQLQERISNLTQLLD